MREPPDTIFLQYYGDAAPEDNGSDPAEVTWSEITWCKDQIFEHDIKYVRVSSDKGLPT